MTMTMRALLEKLDETRGNLRWSHGSGFVIRSCDVVSEDAAIVFWTPSRVRDEALRLDKY